MFSCVWNRKQKGTLSKRTHYIKQHTYNVTSASTQVYCNLNSACVSVLSKCRESWMSSMWALVEDTISQLRQNILQLETLKHLFQLRLIMIRIYYQNQFSRWLPNSANELLEMKWVQDLNNICEWKHHASFQAAVSALPSWHCTSSGRWSQTVCFRWWNP